MTNEHDAKQIYWRYYLKKIMNLRQTKILVLLFLDNCVKDLLCNIHSYLLQINKSLEMDLYWNNCIFNNTKQKSFVEIVSHYSQWSSYYAIMLDMNLTSIGYYVMDLNMTMKFSLSLYFFQSIHETKMISNEILRTWYIVGMLIISNGD